MQDVWLQLEPVWNSLHGCSNRILLLDYDGTLAPFNAKRAAALPYPEVVQALTALVRAGHTRVVFVSGRPVSELAQLFPLASEVEVYGCHGLEHRLPGGAVASRPVAPKAQEELRQISAALDRAGYSKYVEHKLGCLAVHWRARSSATIDELRTFVEALHRAGNGAGELLLLEFDGGLEFRWRQATKASVIERMKSAARPAAVIAYLGDDTTDEDAFAALGEDGLSILVRTSYRPTAARYWLVPPHELVKFLECWHAAGTQQQQQEDRG